MLSLDEVGEILGIPLLGVIPESPTVLAASNAGTPVILEQASDAAQAYSDTVARFLGEEKPLRFITEERSILRRLFGSRA
jgi:septum site-determining protein MinD